MNNKHYDEALDALIKIAGLELLEEDASEMPSDDEITDLEINLSGVDNQIEKEINKNIRKDRAKRIRRITLRVAVVFLAVMVTSTIAIMSSEALRVKLMNMFFKSNKISSEINITENDLAEEKSTGFIEPGYIPLGYELIEVIQAGLLLIGRYTNTDGEEILIEQDVGESQIVLDNENVNTYQAEIDGRRIFVVEGEEDNKVIFNTDIYNYTIIGVEDVAELLEIAESLQ